MTGMKQVLATAVAVQFVLAAAVRSGHGTGADESACRTLDEGRRALLHAKLAVLGVDCEEMCKRVGEYPNCQCPGFEGSPATEEDTRMCLDKYCQDPSTPCPNDNFVTCVKEATKVSALQWSSLLQRLGSALALGANTSSARAMAGLEGGSCVEQDSKHRAFIQTRLASFGVQCEEMCKRMGIYPNCDCPGFEGSPASAGDERACMDKFCQDPKTPCPNDNFVICVKENTKVSALQWSSLMQLFDASSKLWGRMLRVVKEQHRVSRH